MSPPEGRRSEVQCPRCGRPAHRLIRGKCPECLLETEDLLNIKDIEIEICKRCLRYKHRSEWRREGVRLLPVAYAAARELLPPKIKVRRPGNLADLRLERPRISGKKLKMDVVAAITGLDEDEQRTVRDRVSIPLNFSICRVCELKESPFYASIVQLRGESRPLEEDEIEAVSEVVINKSIPNRFDSLDYLSRITDVNEGRNFYFGSLSMGREVAKEIASRWGGRPKETRKLVGVDKGSGKKQYRSTILVRLPKLRAGDIAKHNGRFYRVIGHSGSKTYLSGNEENIVVDRRRHPELELVTTHEEVGQALVLEVRPDGIQILDPRSNRPFDFNSKPPGARVGEKVEVFWIHDTPQLAPERREVDE